MYCQLCRTNYGCISGHIYGTASALCVRLVPGPNSLRLPGTLQQFDRDLTLLTEAMFLTCHNSIASWTRFPDGNRLFVVLYLLLLEQILNPFQSCELSIHTHPQCSFDCETKYASFVDGRPSSLSTNIALRLILLVLFSLRRRAQKLLFGTLRRAFWTGKRNAFDEKGVQFTVAMLQIDV